MPLPPALATIPHTLGFDSLEHETVIDSLPVHGELPSWLRGSLLRTGPAKFEVGEQRLRHWFDGLAMLHRFTVADARVSYANRFLESRAYRAARERGRIEYREFATDPCRSLFRRVHSLFAAGSSDNANVNVARLGERFLAMTETPLPVQFDPATLAAADASDLAAPGQLASAHPHLDRDGGGILNYAARLGRTSSYRFYALDAHGGAPRVIAERPTKEPAYMHSFGLTERWLVLAEFPLVVNPLALALSGRPYIENYRWKPQRGTRFTLIDRASGEATTGFETEACFAFHHVNAFERDGEVAVDVCTYPDAGLIEDLYLERLRAGKPLARATLTRFRLRLSNRSVAREPLSDQDVELPRIAYARVNERPYGHVWGVAAGDSGWIERIVKVDVADGAAQVWAEDGCHAGEPVFVARPEAEREDDGVLLSVVLNSRAGASFLLVLDAHNLQELARAEVPHHIPFGFHGQFERGLTPG